MSLAVELFNAARSSVKLNGLALSRVTAIPCSTLFFNVNGGYKWSADNWIKSMAAIGAVRIKDETMTIRSKISASGAKILGDIIEKGRSLK